MRLISFRLLIAAVIALILGFWFYPVSGPTQRWLMMFIALATVLLFLVQIKMRGLAMAEFKQSVFQFSSDVFLVSLLILATGGIFSPFSFLLGMTIIASGAYANRILPLLISGLAGAAYLITIYVELWLSHSSILNQQQALHVLLQVSALMLVGGVMAYIARRHANLSASSDHAVRQHRKLKDLHDKMMAEMREGVILLDQQLRLIDMNEAASVMIQRNALASLLSFQPLAEFFEQYNPPTELSAFQCEYDETDNTLLLAVRQLRVEDDAVWLLTIVDISEVRQLQEQLIQQEKMAALGQMAAMLAHEIRNPIQTMAQSLEIMTKSPANVVQMQHVLHDEMMRLNRLVNIMLQYSKPLQATLSKTNMSALIEASVLQIDVSLRQYIHCQSALNELYLDGDHFRLVLDNLLSNALANRSDAFSPVDIHLSLDQHHWMLEVCNQGEIMPAVRDRLFDPFVSGRPAGVGLGLATVQQVCHINHWKIELVSDNGRTCFMIRGKVIGRQGNG